MEIELDAVVQGKLEQDTEFQATLADLSDEEKEPLIAQKKSEILKQEFQSLAEAKKKAEEAFKDQQGRATKAEEELKKGRPASENEERTLSPKDTLALIENKVSTEDFDEVIRVAKVLGKPVSEALKDNTMKTILETRAEERRTAAATQTKGSPQGTSKIDGDSLLQKARSTGEVPESTEGMKALFKAHLASKFPKRK